MKVKKKNEEVGELSDEETENQGEYEVKDANAGNSPGQEEGDEYSCSGSEYSSSDHDSDSDHEVQHPAIGCHPLVLFLLRIRGRAATSSLGLHVSAYYITPDTSCEQFRTPGLLRLEECNRSDEHDEFFVLTLLSIIKLVCIFLT